jgi:hypothetical protein
MKSEVCEFEEAVGTASSSGLWADELRKHLAVCSQCSDLRLVSEYLASARLVDDAAPLPAAGLIWWRAQLAERKERAARAMVAIEIMQKLAIAVALVIVMVIGSLWKPVDWSTLLMGAGLLLSTSAVLYGWVRGRI